MQPARPPVRWTRRATAGRMAPIDLSGPLKLDWTIFVRPEHWPSHMSGLVCMLVLKVYTPQSSSLNPPWHCWPNQFPRRPSDQLTLFSLCTTTLSPSPIWTCRSSISLCACFDLLIDFVHLQSQRSLLATVVLLSYFVLYLVELPHSAISPSGEQLKRLRYPW